MQQWPADPPEVTTIWRAISRCLWWAVSIVLVCIGLTLFKPQIDRREKLDRRISELRAQRAAARAAHDSLRDKLGWVKTDPEFIEAIARDRLDLARENEMIFQFPVER
jgi:cell division protein FtsB